ncbi:MAG: acyltransferase family protein [Desulfobulbaceae bacterium]|nr:acyltransferase family protein [Desulfobulbaceae bacterium]
MQSNAVSDQHPFEWILIAKGIGIILVVIGHFRPEASPRYWCELIDVIYTFHMALFFSLSGYLCSFGNYSYRAFLKKKTERLLFPFVSIGAIFFLIKYTAGKMVSLEYPVTVDALYTLFVDPPHSHMPLLWFVHALYLMFVCYPLARIFLNGPLILVLLIITNLLFGSNFKIFGPALSYMPFFVIGAFSKEYKVHLQVFMNHDPRYLIVLLLLFLSVYIGRLLGLLESINEYAPIFFLGAVGSLLIVIASRAISSLSRNTKIKGLLVQVGLYSMTIYLFHTLFESTIKIGLLKAGNVIPIPFEFIALTAIICGVFFPLMLEKKVFRKYWVTRKVILGLS